MSEDTATAAEAAAAKIERAADIVSAYVGHNTIGMTEIPELISTVHAALKGLGGEAKPETRPLEPAVSPRTAVKPDSIACLECGKRFKSMKRHLNTHHGLTADEYRTKWSLRPDYPVVAREYAEARSKLARESGLGQKGRRRR